MVMPDAAQRAVLCALEMQKVMRGVNEYNFQMGWPEIEMGIGIHTGEVVVSNIGSTKRSKCGVVGRTANLTVCIESFHRRWAGARLFNLDKRPWTNKLDDIYRILKYLFVFTGP